MRKILLLMQALLLLTPALFAQKNISGKILDDQGSPIPFASITLKDKSKGAITDAEGNFSLPNIPDGSVIIVTSQGYLSKQITVSTGMNWIISMQPAVNQLKEVVVTTALGVSRSKKTVGYATQQLGTEKISQTKVADLNTAIAGKIAGLQIRGGSGAKFGTSTIHLRGINTLSGASPIYVVDGVILTNASGINPDDIESLNVLKGPAATALYGQRGSEGAVIITSKKAAKKGIGVDINHTTTFENVYVLPEYQNEYGGGSGQDWLTFHYDPAIHPASLSVLDGAKYYRYDVDESWGPKMDGTLYAPWYAWDASDVDFGKQKPFNPQPNNVRDFYNAGIGNNTTVALSKATAVSNMRLSFTNLTRTGVIPNSKQQKNWVVLTSSADLTERLNFSTNINYVYEYLFNIPQEGYGTQTTGSFNQWFHRDADINKLRRYKRPDGTFTTWNITGPTNLAAKFWDNPFTEIYENISHNYFQRVFGNATISYKISGGLKLSVIARGTFNNQQGDARAASFTINTPSFATFENKYKETSYLGGLEYDHVFNWLSVRASAYGELNKQENYNIRAATNGGFIQPNVYNVSNSLNEKIATNFMSIKKVNSLFGYVTLGLKDILFVDLSVRNDISSALPKANNSYVYGSASGSFVFSQLMKNSILSFGKLRASIAKVGTDVGPYNTTLSFPLGTNYVKPLGSGSVTYSVQTSPNQLPSSNLKPTLSTSYEIGTELQFFKNRLRLDFNYYKRNSKDQILGITTPGTIGYTSLLGNAGNIRNWGYEITLGGTPFRKKDFNWDIDFNLGINKNRVVELTAGIDNLQVGLDGSNLAFGFVGSPAVSLNAKVGQPYGKIIGNGIKKDANGNRLVDDDGLYITEDNMDLGNLLPDYTGGISSSISYKNLFLNFSLDFQKGGRFISITKMFNSGSGLAMETAGLNDKGNPKRNDVADGGGVRLPGVNATTGKENTVYVDTKDLYESYLFSVWENWMYDASYIKLRELSLGYNIPRSVYKNLPFEKISFSVIGQNLWLMYSKVKGLDPSELEQSWIEGGQLPGTRSIGVNLKLTF